MELDALLHNFQFLCDYIKLTLKHTDERKFVSPLVCRYNIVKSLDSDELIFRGLVPRQVSYKHKMPKIYAPTLNK